MKEKLEKLGVKVEDLKFHKLLNESQKDHVFVCVEETNDWMFGDHRRQKGKLKEERPEAVLPVGTIVCCQYSNVFDKTITPFNNHYCANYVKDNFVEISQEELKEIESLIK